MNVDRYLTVHSVLVLAAILCAVFAIFPPNRPANVAVVRWHEWSWLLFLLAVFFV